MDKLGTYALLAAIKGMDAKTDTINPADERKRQSDKWIALQASKHDEVPPHRMPLDPPAPAKSPAQRNIYIRQINDRMDRAILAQGGTVDPMKQY